MAYINGNEILFSPQIINNNNSGSVDTDEIVQEVINNLPIETAVNKSTNPVSSKAVYEEFNEFSNAYDKVIEDAKTECKNYTDTEIEEVNSQHAEMTVSLSDRITAVEGNIGDIETALDSIIAIQTSLIGGGSV